MRPVVITLAVVVPLVIATIAFWPFGATAPPPVQHLKAVVTPGSVTLSWTAATGTPAADTFRIEHNGTPIGTVGSSVATFTDHNVTPGTRYTYAVIGVAGGHQSTPTKITIETGVPPVSAAAFAGTYRVQIVLTSAQGWQSLHAGSRDTETWTFSSDGRHLSGASPGGSWSMPVHRQGAHVVGSAKDAQSKCFLTIISDTLTMDVHATAGKVADGRWVAARFAGTFRDVAPAATSGIYTCGGSSYTASVTGVRS